VAAARLLPETENGQQSFVDAPLLLRTDPADKVSQAAGVDSADLLDKDAAGLTEQVNLRTERRGPCVVRCRSYEYDRARQQLVRLHDHAVSAALLLMTSSAWGAELVNVTPEHACSP
jgi:hypothetical protein